jgi:hypothetical protein
MREKDSTQSVPKVLSHSRLLAMATSLCNELDELTVLHHFFYQAAEDYFSDQGGSFRHGLSLLPNWIRERDLSVLESVHKLQEQLRTVKQYQE